MDIFEATPCLWDQNSFDFVDGGAGNYYELKDKFPLQKGCPPIAIILDLAVAV